MINKYMVYKIAVVAMLSSIASYSNAVAFGFSRIALTHVGCVGNDGVISISVTKNPEDTVLYRITPEGGTPITQPNNGVFTGLSVGQYLIEAALNGTGPVIQASVLIVSGAPVSIETVFIRPVTVRGGNNGSISVAVRGGRGAYSYTINTIPSTTGPNFNNLTAGTYVIRVTSEDGCPAAVVSVNVVQPAAS